MTTATQATAAEVGKRMPIRNPVLPGFHPDPSILRVGKDYYLATSTFEWYPGVRLHHSTDLVHWRPLGGILTEHRLLDLSGAGDSCGVWAPHLSHVDGLFHLVYTHVSSFDSGYWDSQNYLITAPDPIGPWSDPIALHARGFDPSLFHDEDGTTWLLCMSADWRTGHDRFGGIQVQQYDRAARRLVGEEHHIFDGTEVGMTEAPHVYRKGGWYYLLTAEGGTSWEHQAVVARSRSLFGPYDVAPGGPLLTSVGSPDLPLQKAGHGSLVCTSEGEWYLAHLAARPYSPRGRCVLGRETAIQAVDWDREGWPRVAGGVPAEVVSPPLGGAVGRGTLAKELDHDDFEGTGLGPDWSTLRRPATDEWVRLTARPSHLRVFGGQSPVGRQRPSLVARRVTAPHCSFETTMEFRPSGFRQLAGITAYYNTRNWHYLYLSRDGERQVLELMTCDTGRRSRHADCRVDATGADRLRLRVEFDGPVLRFDYALLGATAGGGVGEEWRELPAELDATILSDEHAARFEEGEPEVWGFTGAFVGLWVQDLGADGGFADFDSATYRVLPPY